VFLGVIDEIAQLFQGADAGTASRRRIGEARARRGSELRDF